MEKECRLFCTFDSIIFPVFILSITLVQRKDPFCTDFCDTESFELVLKVLSITGWFIITFGLINLAAFYFSREKKIDGLKTNNKFELLNPTTRIKQIFRSKYKNRAKIYTLNAQTDPLCVICKLPANIDMEVSDFKCSAKHKVHTECIKNMGALSDFTCPLCEKEPTIPLPGSQTN
jgi:hypothetical protein